MSDSESYRPDDEIFRFLLEEIEGHAIFTLDLDGAITSWNPGAERFFGWAEDEALGQPYALLFLPEEVATGVPERELEEARSGPVRADRWHLRKDGSRTWTRGVLSGLHNGGLRGFAKVIEDRDSEHRAREALRESQQLYVHLAEAVPAIVWTASPQGDVEFLNRQWDRITGRPGGTSLGWAWLEAVHPEDVERCRAVWSAALESRQPYEVELRLQSGEGSYRWFLARGMPVASADGRLARWFGATIDIDDRKRAEQLLASANQQKEEFLAMLAHELRNPLAPILNAVHLLGHQEATPEARDRAREIIERQVMALGRIVDDLLEISRLDRGKTRVERQPTALDAVVERAVEACRQQIEARGLLVATYLPERPPWVDGDATRLEQVVVNLLHNACKYSEADEQIEIRLEVDGEYAVLSIQDQGIGIEPQMLERIFEPFAQAERSLDRAQGGLGLGLALVRSVVALHGGDVKAISAGPGEGSRFVVRLPVCPAPDQSEGDGTSLRGELGAPRVLVVDDNQDAADTLAAVLRLHGCEVEVVVSGEEVLPAALRFAPRVVLLDIGLPTLDGYQVARLLRGNPESADVHLVAITGYGQQVDRQRSEEAGFDLHLVKPVDPSGILDLLARLAQDREPPATD